MGEDKDEPWYFHNCNFCPYRSKSGFIMYKHNILHDLHREQSNSNTFICYANTPVMFECEFCDFDTSMKVNLTEHFRVVHEEKEVNKEMKNILKCHRCENCDFKTHSVVVLTKHLSSCDAVFRTNPNKEVESVDEVTKGDSYDYEVKTSEGIDWIKCKRCDFVTREVSDMKSHVFLEHVQTENICAQCGFKANSARRLQRHVQEKHEHRNLFECQRCTYKAKRKGNLTQHIYRKHNTKKNMVCFQCEDCAFETNAKLDLRRHIKMKHSNPEIFEWFHCDLCAYTSMEKNNLSRHMYRMHKIASLYKCEHCTFKTKKLSSVRKHIIVKHGNSEDSTIDVDKWYEFTSPEGVKCLKCKHCIYTTSKSDQMKSHLLKHLNASRLIENDNWYTLVTPEGVTWLKCKQCVLMTKKIEDMESHVLSEHVNAEYTEWFKCVLCVFKTKSERNLQQHILVEHVKGEKNEEVNQVTSETVWFECTQCPFKTRKKSSLIQHVGIHEIRESKGIKLKTKSLFQCGQCTFRSDLKYEICQHINTTIHHTKGNLMLKIHNING